MADTRPNVTRSVPPVVAAAPNTALPRPSVAPSSRPVDGARAGGVDGDDREVAVGVDAGHGALRRASVAERHGHLAAAQVVGVGQDPAVGDDDAGAAGMAADGDDGRADGGRHAGDGIGQIVRVVMGRWSPLGWVLAMCRLVTCKLLPTASRRKPPGGTIAGDAHPAPVRQRRRADRVAIAPRARAGPGRRPLEPARSSSPCSTAARRFGELSERLPGIAPNILTDRLRRLERAGIVRSTPYQERPTRLALRADRRRPRPGVGPAPAGRLGRSPRRRCRAAPPRDAAGPPLEARWYCPTCAVPVEDTDAPEDRLL